MTVFVFSGTGNSLYAAKALGGNIRSIPELLESDERVFSDDRIGFVFPVYWLCIPEPVRIFLESSTFRSDYLFALVTCGGAALTAKAELSAIAKRRGFKFSLIRALRMPDNYAPAFDISKVNGKLDMDAVDRRVASAVSAVTDSRENTTDYPVLSLFLPAALRRAARESDAFDRRIFSVDGACTGCGLCASVCPADNIRVEDRKPQYLGHCWCCLACTGVCPNRAIHVKGEKNSARYINEHVGVSGLVRTHASPDE